ncbi:uncharacterized protein LOC143296669 [Babylonia areolata]|uniref:uncharacterized protein LOC143296669 n=1 Tax=Babylonia areolata TaxID=304850 RepID=UPI003FD3C3CD
MNDDFTTHGELTASNLSLPDGCVDVILIDSEHLPSKSHHDIVSSETETILRRVKDCVLAIMFLIGGPGNVINMAVFYKQSLKDRVNLCLFALALADVIHLIMSMLHHGEQLYLQLTTKEKFGPVDTFLTNNNLLGLMGFSYVSYILSAIIATERCLCVFNPLKFQTMLRTRTMAAIIGAVYIIVLGLYFILATRHRIGCVYDQLSGQVVKKSINGDFYKNNRVFIDSLDSFVFGAGVPGVVMIVVMTTTKLTITKLRQIATWRAETSSSSIPPREVTLTKMLVGNSILFIACVSPAAVTRISWLFVPGMISPRENLTFFLSSLWIIEIFTFINASLNIFVYYAMGSRYRETFWALFGRKSSCDNKEHSSQTITSTEIK